jgi:ubiquinone/menaquinone biosynthesis C-methylase UbiE
VSVSGTIYATCYDRLTAGTEKAGLAKLRASLLARASGRVLEIGAGTGSNLRHYGGAVDSLVAAEPEAAMTRRLERKARGLGLELQVVQTPAETLPFRDASFDVAVSTLVLCTVDDQLTALAELRRVLVPGGRLLFLEHVRSEERRVARWQDRLNGVNRVIGAGCNCNRSTLETIRAAGFRIAEVEQDRLPKAPPFLRPLVIGVAESPA